MCLRLRWLRLSLLSVLLFGLAAHGHAAGGRSVETALVSLVDSLLLAVPQSTTVHRLAIVPFDDRAGGAEADRGVAVAELVLAQLAARNRFSLVDRAEFRKMLDEIELSQSDLVEESGALQAGKMLAADALLTGSLTELFGTVRVTAKIIRTETSEILATASVTVVRNALDDFARGLIDEKGRVSSSVFRSLLAPGWGQFYTNKYARGAISLTLCAGAAGYCAYAIAATVGAHNDYDDYYEYVQFSQEFEDRVQAEAAETGRPIDSIRADYDDIVDEYYNDYVAAHDRAVLAGVITGAAWALNLIDAAIAGAQSRRKFRLYFMALPGAGGGAGLSIAIAGRRN